MKIKIAAEIPNHRDGTSFYRAMGPLTGLIKTNHVEVNMKESWNWIELTQCDVFFMQRPFHSQHVAVANMVKKHRKPLWLDFDDDFFSIPESNAAHPMFMNESVHASLKEILSMADAVTVSTLKLKEVYSKYTANVHYIPNSFNDHILPERTIGKRRKLITWRGGITHEEDLMSVIGQLASVAAANKDWVWNFIGNVPWFVREAIPAAQLIITQPMEIMEMHQYLMNICSAIHIVPLKNNEFNLSKSNVAWIESAYAGSSCLAPDMPEWRREGITNYKSESDFGWKLQKMIDNCAELECGWDQIDRENLTSYTNELRLKILNRLINY
jgi:hypothetical protein